jgi:pimeloyl-ACP methyl ester carboxylesterase
MRWISLLVLLALGSCERAQVPASGSAPTLRPPTEGQAPVASASADATRPPPRSSAAAAPASLVRGTDGSSTHLVFMPGLCSNAYAYLLAFPEVARAHGGIVAIDGDRPCGAADSGFRSFTWSPKLQRSRLEAALSAAGVPIPPDGLTLIGYSSGASIAELMHGEWPALFPRLVLIAPPKDPSVARLKTAAGVVFMACSLDVTGRMKSAAKNLVPAGVPSLYLEMPGCTHGNMADGERIFGEAFDWLEERR